MDRNGFWVRKSLRNNEVISLIKVENGYEDFYWDFDEERFERAERNVAELGMSDDYDFIDEKEALELLGRSSW